jgi:hypothetical protein
MNYPRMKSRQRVAAQYRDLARLNLGRPEPKPVGRGLPSLASEADGARSRRQAEVTRRAKRVPVTLAPVGL